MERTDESVEAEVKARGSGPAEADDPAAEGAPAASETPWTPSPPQILRYRDHEALVEAAAKRFAETATRAIERDDRFIVALGGGPVWRSVYERLTASPHREAVAWDRCYFAFVDERCTPPDDESSNFRMAQETLFGPLEIPPLHVLRMKGEQVPADAARRYAVRLGDLFLNRAKRQFDLVLLDIDPEGGVGALRPASPALDEREAWVTAAQLPGEAVSRLTLTLPALSSARRVIFVATGEDKAEAVARAFGGGEQQPSLPCALVAPPGARREILLDEAAASFLTTSRSPAA